MASVTAGNGAIYAVRRAAYVELDAASSHDLAFPFMMVKRGRRAVFAPEARATERPVPSIEGEFARKRRMMRRGWPIVLRGGMLSPRGYGVAYSLMIASHRVLRYATPFLHLIALAANVALVAIGSGPLYVVTLGAAGRPARGRPAGSPAAAAPAAPRAVLRAHDRLARGRPVGLAAPRRSARLGSRPGRALTASGYSGTGMNSGPLLM